MKKILIIGTNPALLSALLEQMAGKEDQQIIVIDGPSKIEDARNQLLDMPPRMPITISDLASAVPDKPLLSQSPKTNSDEDGINS